MGTCRVTPRRWLRRLSPRLSARALSARPGGAHPWPLLYENHPTPALSLSLSHFKCMFEAAIAGKDACPDRPNLACWQTLFNEMLWVLTTF